MLWTVIFYSSGDSTEVTSLSNTTISTLINKTVLPLSTDVINPSNNVIRSSKITLETSDSLPVTSKNEFISSSSISQPSLLSSTSTTPSETPTTQSSSETPTTHSSSDTPTTQSTTNTDTTQSTSNTKPTTEHITKPPDAHSEVTTEDPLIPTTPPGESEESVASISIFFILVLLGMCLNNLRYCYCFKYFRCLCYYGTSVY